MHFPQDWWGQISFHLFGHFDILFMGSLLLIFFFRLPAYNMQYFPYQLSDDQKVWKYNSDEKMEKHAFPKFKGV